MDMLSFLAAKDTSLGAVAQYANQRIPFGDGDVLLAVGSLVEGLGGERSDLDLLLITRRTPADLPEGGNLSWASGKCLVDMRALAWNDMELLVARLDHWAARSWDVTRAPRFTIDERTLLHRLWSGVVIEWSRAGSPSHPQPDAANLVRLKQHVARQDARTIQVDMAGLAIAGDHRSLAFAAMQLMGNAIDVIVAAHGMTNPLVKWRSRLLASLPDDAGPIADMHDGVSVSDRVWDLVRFPHECDDRSVSLFAHRIVGFARAAFAWAECRQRGIEWGGLMPRADAIPPQPFVLSFDTDFALLPEDDRRGDDQSVRLARLNAFDGGIDLTLADFRALMRYEMTVLDGFASTAVHREAAVGAVPTGLFGDLNAARLLAAPRFV